MASEDEIFSAENRYGRQYGIRSFRNSCDRLAPSVRNSSRYSMSAALRPLTAFTSTGKKQIRITATILDHHPVPSQITSNGATATIGVVLTAMAIGNRPSSSVLNRTNMMAQPNASTPAIRKPISASTNVTTSWIASVRSTLAKMAVGAGNRYSGMLASMTIACQAASATSANISGV